MAIINDNFFDALESGATWAAGVAFQRSNPLPLDKYSVFETRALAESYATTNAVAYPGQIVAFVEDGEMKVCVLAEVANEGEEQTYSLGLQEIGGKIDLDNTSLSFNETTGLLEVSGFKGAATATLPQKKVDSEGKESIEWVSIDAIVEGDGNTTYTVTPLVKNVGTEEAPINEIYGFTFTPSEGSATEIKLDVYTKTEVDKKILGLEDAISKLNHFTTKIVTSIDEVTETSILYLIKSKDVEGKDNYDEYLYIEGQGAVLIGDTSTDLSDYYNKTEIDNKVKDINELITEEVSTLENSLYSGSYVKGDETISSDIAESDRDASRLITPAEIAKLSALVLGEDGSVGVSGTISADNVTGLDTRIESVVTGENGLKIESGAQVNKIEKVIFNGTEATIADKVATITGEYYTKTETDAKIKTVSDTLAEVQTTANSAKSTAEANTTELNTLKGTVDGHTTSINKNSSDIAALVTKVAIEEGKVGTLETTVAGKADNSTVTTLAERVGVNEGNITNLTTRVSANETAISGINETLGNKINSSEVYTKSEINAITGSVTEGKTIVDMISDAQTAATYDDTQVKADIKKNTDAIALLNGDDTTAGSVDYKVAQEIAKIVNDNNDGTINTLNEIATWIVSDTTGAAKMNADIAANTAAITKLNGTVNTEGSVLSMIAANAPKIATTELAGLVKSVANTVENGVAVAEDGTMSVNSLNVNKLVQDENDTLILNGGSANA